MKRKENRQQRLVERLQREARRSRPEFSESLHERICEGIGLQVTGDRGQVTGESVVGYRLSVVATGKGSLRGRAAIGRNGQLWMAAAVALLLAAGAWLWQAARPAREDAGPLVADRGLRDSTPIPGDPVHEWTVVREFAEQTSERLNDLTAAALRAHRWAYLDADAKSALSALTDHFPITPDALAWAAPAKSEE